MKFLSLEPAYLDLKAAAAYTSLSVRTLRDHIKKPGGPPIYRISKKILLKKTEVDAWLESFKVDLDLLAKRVLEGFREKHP